MLKTIGISPKVKAPAVALATLGVLVIIAGVLLGEQLLTSAGAALIAASGISFSVGYTAPPGQLGLAHAVQPIDPAEVLKVLEQAKTIGSELAAAAAVTSAPAPASPAAAPPA